MAPKNYQQRQQAAAAPKPDRPNNSNKPNNKPNNAPKKKKSAAPADPTAPPENQEGAGYYDPNRVGVGNGDPYDPNNSYGRAPVNANPVSFDDWLADSGYGTKKSLGKNQLKRRKAEYQQYQGPLADPSNPNGDWSQTGEGKHYIDDNPDAYVHWLRGEQGALSGDVPVYGGPTNFGQWLATTRNEELMTGYNAAKIQSGDNLSFVDYMTSQGYGPTNPQSFNTAATGPYQPGVPPHDTGNPFTSTSMPLTASAVTPNNPDFPSTPQTFGQYRQDQGIGQHQWLNMRNKRQNRIHNAFMGDQPTNAGTVTPPSPTAAATPPAITGGGIDADRRRYAAMTPQQQGINAATSNRPTRWSVF